MSETLSTLGKIEVMKAYLDGEDICIRATQGIDHRIIIRNINIFGQACSMGWNWEDYTYDVIKKEIPITAEKYTNVMGGNVYNLYQTEKEAIFHSNHRFDRAGVKVKITEIV